MFARLLIASTALILPIAASAQSVRAPNILSRVNQASSASLGYTGRTRSEEICLTRKADGERVCKTRRQWRDYAATLKRPVSK